MKRIPYTYFKDNTAIYDFYIPILEIEIPNDIPIVVKMDENGIITHWHRNELDYFLNDYERQIIKDTFKQCFGLQSCLKSVRTQGDAIVILSERTALSKQFISDNLVEICNL